MTKQMYRGRCSRCKTQLPTTTEPAISIYNKTKICRDCETNEVFKDFFKRWDSKIPERKVNERR